MHIFEWLKHVLRKTRRTLFVSITILGIAIVIGLALFAYLSSSCKRNIVRTIIPLTNSATDILIVDDACSVDTEIVAEDRQTHKRRSLADFTVMESDINIAVIDNQIVVTVPTFEGMSRHMEKVDSYPVVFKSEASTPK